MTSRASAIFFGHGNPMNALGGPFAAEWGALGESMQKPAAVLMISAHWQTRGLGVTAMARPRTIHDFYGFPPQLFAVDYPAPGSPALAARVVDLLAADKAVVDQDWGLDHGTWSVLTHVFPKADVPVLQLSLNADLSPAQHLDLARRLGGLRDEGVMIAGSGDVVHNLSLARFRHGESADPYDWAVRFHDHCKAAIAARDYAALLPGPDLGPDAAKAIPTDEHWLPLFYALGAARDDETPRFFTDTMDAGSISMLGVAFGI